MIENFVLFVLVMTNIVLIMALSMLTEDDRKRGDFWAERYDDLRDQYSQLLNVVLKSDTPIKHNL